MNLLLKPKDKTPALLCPDHFIMICIHLFAIKFKKLLYVLVTDRSDNAIKNYWNCVLKKNLDSNSLHGCTMDLFTVSSLNSYNCDTELNCLKLKERQSVEKAAFVNENIELRCSAETSASRSVHHFFCFMLM